MPTANGDTLATCLLDRCSYVGFFQTVPIFLDSSIPVQLLLHRLLQAVTHNTQFLGIPASLPRIGRSQRRYRREKQCPCLEHLKQRRQVRSEEHTSELQS